jgi:hypothetical protein
MEGGRLSHHRDPKESRKQSQGCESIQSLKNSSHKSINQQPTQRQGCAENKHPPSLTLEPVNLVAAVIVSSHSNLLNSFTTATITTARMNIWQGRGMVVIRATPSFEPHPTRDYQTLSSSPSNH